MERRLPPPRHVGVAPHKPSFSSTLLDAIYHSIDGDDGVDSNEPCLPTSRKHTATVASAAVSETRNNTTMMKVALRRHVQVFNSVTSSSSSSSSSDTEAVLRPIRTGGHPVVQQQTHKSGTARRNREKPPASPGARLAGFLSSLWKAKAAEGKIARTPVAAGGLKRSVRFVEPVSVDDGTPAVLARRRQVKDRGEELRLWKFEEDGGEESDSSSDLFELENLKPGIVGGRRGYKDELPVYETTGHRARRGPPIRLSSSCR